MILRNLELTNVKMLMSLWNLAKSLAPTKFQSGRTVVNTNLARWGASPDLQVNCIDLNRMIGCQESSSSNGCQGNVTDIFKILHLLRYVDIHFHLLRYIKKMHLKMSSAKLQPFYFGLSVFTIYLSLGLDELTHWGQDKRATILQMTFSNAFSWTKFLYVDLNSP